MVMATDAFSNIAANVRSLGLAIEALRQLERHGGSADAMAELNEARDDALRDLGG